MSALNRFLRDNRGILIISPFYAALVVVITILYDINIEYCFYIIGFFVIFLAVSLGIQFGNYKRQLQNEKITIDTDADDKQKWQLCRENEDFFALWTHQIKTPIAALDVLLQNDKIETIACRQELIKIENYVEMALGYTRYENMSNDLVLESHDLSDIVKGVVKKYSTIFIYKHIAVKLDNLDHKVLTDDKWFSFVLEQIISNALKYTAQGQISIYGKECTDGLQIVVSDTGIGIQESDLPRIFEKGFTGYNGRMDKKASGLGLYLCKGVCNKLGHRISIESKVNCGTKVIILMQCENVKQSDLTKM